ncbi:MAG: 2OG-Fe(II) oxygenase [Galbitalea sp.]
MLDGDDPTSLEEPGSSIDYVLVDGQSVADQLPWLQSLYENELLKIASEFAGVQLAVADDLNVGVNVNSLPRAGSRYEWHMDSNPFTALLFATTLVPGDGGELVFRRDHVDIAVRPVAGLALFFDARKTAHTVMPMQADVRRISLPMNYYIAGEAQTRGGLDEYLYAKS